VKKLNLHQRSILAEFLANFALAWLTFGVISPIFTGIDDLKIFLLKLFISIIFAGLSLKFALDMLK
jgi:hypothetical protein